MSSLQDCFCAPDLRQTQFSKVNHVHCQPNSSKAYFKKIMTILVNIFSACSTLQSTLYILSLLLTLKIFIVEETGFRNVDYFAQYGTG